MSQESEFLERHRADLRQAAELCTLLQRGAVELVERRQRHLRALRRLCRSMGAACRVVAMERGEDEIRGSGEFGAFPWLERANFYAAKVPAVIDRIARDGRTWSGSPAWLQFGQVRAVFETGLAALDRLATRPSGNTSKSFRPGQSLLILPPYLQKRPTPRGIILP
jgi:hypothetical protein